MPTSLCDLFGSDEEEVEFEGFRQNEVDQLEACYKLRCVRSLMMRSMKKLTQIKDLQKSSNEKLYLNHFELHKPVFVFLVQ